MAHAPERTINRYYDPTTDQFLSVDPAVEQTNQPYVFTNDDPLNAEDPLGEDDAGWQYVQQCDASPACEDAPFTWQEGLAIVVNAVDVFGPDETGFGEIVDAGADDFAAESVANDSEGTAISNADIHGTLATESRGMDAEYVRANGERAYDVDDDETRAVNILDKGNGNSDIVIDRLGATAGDKPISTYELTNGQVDARFISGRWIRELGG
jgi:hypothetical protein